MSADASLQERLRFLARVVERECRHLQTTDGRLFREPFTVEHARRLGEDVELAERVEAFVGRFGRLQDTVGDKLLPAYLRAAGETPGVAVDNLDRAERLGLVDSADQWLALRKLRNQMVHEYIEEAEIHANALASGHAGVTLLVSAAERILADMRQRGWVK